MMNRCRQISGEPNIQPETTEQSSTTDLNTIIKRKKKKKVVTKFRRDAPVRCTNSPHTKVVRYERREINQPVPHRENKFQLEMYTLHIHVVMD